jgi:WS/DGAT/MGAT family acyltransferase
MWRIESDPILRSPVVVVGWLAGVPAHDATLGNFARAVAAIPRLRQRIVVGLGGRMQWVDDPDFSLAHHVLFRHSAPRAELRDVLDLAEPDATTPFDTARPPWQCTIVNGLRAKRAAFVFKFHHSLTDGVGGVDWANSLFDHDPLETNVAPPPKPPVAPAAHSGNAVAHATELLQSLRRMLAPVDAPLSPLFVGRGIDRKMEALEVPLAAIVCAADALDVTVNEVFLAAVAGGLSEYHAYFGATAPALRFTMPISLRQEGDETGGNRFAPARFVMPIDDPSLRTRAHIARAIVRAQRREPALKLTDVVAALLARLPTPAVTRIFGDMLRNIDVDIVDVPGLRQRVFLGGAEVLSMWAFAPPTGAALSITLLSHVENCCVAVLCDTKAVADPALLRNCLAHGFDEVAACGAATEARPA